MDHHRSPHVQRLMGGHSSHHSFHPSDKLIRSHHAEGGDIGRPAMAMGGGLPSPQFSPRPAPTPANQLKGIITPQLNTNPPGQYFKDMGNDIGNSFKNIGHKFGFKKGGKAHRRHRDMGGSLEEATMGNKPLNSMKHGGKAHYRHCHKKMAMGGVGKLRKGIM